MEGFKLTDALFRVHAACKDFLYKPIRVHIKFARQASTCAMAKDLIKEIENTFTACEVRVSHEETPVAFGFSELFEVFIVNGDVLHSMRKGDGPLDTDEKRQKVIEDFCFLKHNKMEWLNFHDALFRVRAVCREFCDNVIYKPVRIHIKYTLTQESCAQLKELTDEIRKHFDENQVMITKDICRTEYGFRPVFDVWIVGGTLVHSARRGDGPVDTEEKRQNIVDSLTAAVEVAKIVPNRHYCSTDKSQ